MNEFLQEKLEWYEAVIKENQALARVYCDLQKMHNEEFHSLAVQFEKVKDRICKFIQNELPKSKLKAKNKSANVNTSDFLSQLDEFFEQLESFRIARENSKIDEVNNLLSKINNLKIEIKNLRDEIKEIKHNRKNQENSTKAEKKNLQNEISDLRDELEKTKKNFQSTEESKNKQITELKIQITNLESLNSRQSEDLALKIKEHEKIVSDFEVMKENLLKDFRDQNSILKTDFEKQKANLLCSHEKELQNLKNGMTNEKYLNEANLAIKNLQTENKELFAQAETLKTEIQLLNQKHAFEIQQLKDTEYKRLKQSEKRIIRDILKKKVPLKMDSSSQDSMTACVEHVLIIDKLQAEIQSLKHEITVERENKTPLDQILEAESKRYLAVINDLNKKQKDLLNEIEKNKKSQQNNVLCPENLYDSPSKPEEYPKASRITQKKAFITKKHDFDIKSKHSLESKKNNDQGQRDSLASNVNNFEIQDTTVEKQRNASTMNQNIRKLEENTCISEQFSQNAKHRKLDTSIDKTRKQRILLLSEKAPVVSSIKSKNYIAAKNDSKLFNETDNISLTPASKPDNKKTTSNDNKIQKTSSKKESKKNKKVVVKEKPMSKDTPFIPELQPQNQNIVLFTPKDSNNYNCGSESVFQPKELGPQFNDSLILYENSMKIKSHNTNKKRIITKAQQRQENLIKNQPEKVINIDQGNNKDQIKGNPSKNPSKNVTTQETKEKNQIAQKFHDSKDEKAKERKQITDNILHEKDLIIQAQKINKMMNKSLHDIKNASNIELKEDINFIKLPQIDIQQKSKKFKKEIHESNDEQKEVFSDFNSDLTIKSEIDHIFTPQNYQKKTLSKKPKKKRPLNLSFTKKQSPKPKNNDVPDFFNDLTFNDSSIGQNNPRNKFI